eukprot:TRINITY_DN6570_c0_g1_i1.p1 TRINITY_DN6570_c0_g1~~TRINITY_DN6570_c0_g1_i1.p1  ORF type:complete len:600 (+),score=135.84 TRINITY_DN6570_c0_g1_i1:101-1900(+)
MDANGGRRRLSQAYHESDDAGSVLETQEQELEQNAGVDMKWLRAFLDEIMGKDGQMDLFEFREMWKTVFEDRPMDAAAWRSTADMFNYIDADGSHAVTLSEIIDYLHFTARDVAQATRRPSGVKQWMWQVVGSNPSYEWLTDDDTLLSLGLGLWKALSQVMVVISIVVLMVESVPSMQPQDSDDLPGTTTTFTIETTCVSFFVLEFVMYLYSNPGQEIKLSDEELAEIKEKEDAAAAASDSRRATRRWSTVTEGGPEPTSGYRRAKWSLLLFDFDVWIDILSIVPYFVSRLTRSSAAAGLVAVRVTRILRVLRVLRSLRIARGRAPELCVALQKSLMSLIFLVLLIMIAMCLSAAFMFYIETAEEARFDTSIGRHGAWVRDADSDYRDAGQQLAFQSVPHSMWWALVTLTTVGFGDAYPNSIGGRVVASLTMLAGLVVVGYPITILTSTFQDMEKERQMQEDRKETCREFYHAILSLQRAHQREMQEDGESEDTSLGGGRDDEAAGAAGDAAAPAAPDSPEPAGIGDTSVHMPPIAPLSLREGTGHDQPTSIMRGSTVVERRKSVKVIAPVDGLEHVMAQLQRLEEFERRLTAIEEAVA